MEPTIYKPSAYKTPGIYKGTGGVYKGRGVYNYGAKKINEPKIPYELDIDAFDVNTFYDGFVKYTRQGSACVSKVDGKLRFGQYARFQCFCDQFENIPNKIITEIVGDFSLTNFNYIASLVCGSQIGSGLYWPNLGFFYKYTELQIENILIGSYSSSWEVFKRYSGVPYSQPLKITTKINFDTNNVKCFFNDIQTCELVYNSNFNLKSFMGLLGVFTEDVPSAFVDILSFKVKEDKE